MEEGPSYSATSGSHNDELLDTVSSMKVDRTNYSSNTSIITQEESFTRATMSDSKLCTEQQHPLSPEVLLMTSSEEDIRSESAQDISDNNEVVETSDTVSSTELDPQIEMKIKRIVNAFRTRAQKVKMKIEQPPTPAESFHMTTETSARQQLILGKALKNNIQLFR